MTANATSSSPPDPLVVYRDSIFLPEERGEIRQRMDLIRAALEQRLARKSDFLWLNGKQTDHIGFELTQADRRGKHGPHTIYERCPSIMLTSPTHCQDVALLDELAAMYEAHIKKSVDNYKIIWD